MKTGLTLTEVDERIAAIRENLEQLVEQSTADSSAGNDDLNATRISEQEQELAELPSSERPCCENSGLEARRLPALARLPES